LSPTLSDIRRDLGLFMHAREKEKKKNLTASIGSEFGISRVYRKREEKEHSVGHELENDTGLYQMMSMERNDEKVNMETGCRNVDFKRGKKSEVG